MQETKGASIKVSADDVRKIVLRYLILKGHSETAMALLREARLEGTEEKNLEKIKERKQIVGLVKGGDVGKGIELVNKHFPKLFAENLKIAFKMYSQEWIELIRKGNIEEALLYAQNNFTHFDSAESPYFHSLQEILPLIAYEHPAESPAADHFSVESRLKLAEELNTAILMSQGIRASNDLQRLLHLSTLLMRSRALGNDTYSDPDDSEDDEQSASALEISAMEIDDPLLAPWTISECLALYNK
eukprot:TRINITY_DN22520_c0_g1_i1.p1 TRINITY_DN22520_c0_g1~~TRINITY_DN22520_c0_g1_i1.p1  ORF type:complete len:245 (+),score=43.31 TRINITY_DN22520_c0_g1_i1:52-786(+)